MSLLRLCSGDKEEGKGKGVKKKKEKHYLNNK